MRLGIRTKLVGTLILAGLLPLALALAVGLYAVRRARALNIGQTFRAAALQQAEHLGTLLSSELDFLWLINQLPGTAERLRQANDEALNLQRVQQIEEAWPTLGADNLLLRSVLENPLARRWQTIRRQHPSIAEAIVTDRYGRVVAAPNKTSDYYQADEAWWQAAWNSDEGRTVLGTVEFDSSAGGTGELVLPAAMPIFADMSEEAQKPIGILKASIDAKWLANQLGTAVLPENGVTHRVWLVDQQGRSVLGPVQQTPFTNLPPQLVEFIGAQDDGYVINRDLPGYEVTGFAHVPFPAHGLVADWYVLVTAPRDEVLASTRWMMLVLLLSGIAFIVLCFVGGFWIAQREIVRPLLVLAEGAREVEAGRYDVRLKLPGESGSVFRDDELGILARDFNRMASVLETTVQELNHANETKQQFIDLASHELRTPITYILGVTELAQRQRGPEAPLLVRIAAKARRLNRIAENMFKLIQHGTFESQLRLAPVDVARLVASVGAEFEPFLQMRNQKLQRKLPADVPTIEADGEKLRDILDNLLSNAIRFSPDGATVTLEVNDEPEKVVFIVADQGVGMSPEERARLFEPFFTGAWDELAHHTSGEFQYKTRGAGLGMSVVQRFVEMHGGSVAVESSEKGTRVSVEIPKRGRSGRTAARSEAVQGSSVS